MNTKMYGTEYTDTYSILPMPPSFRALMDTNDNQRSK